ncbi:RICIN domain-containing protein [Embleya sp. NPDC005971]|uniref:RICIN domain-containing protein n=1 Tax=Embleya sp. NPDC005971 TaxID=3156724 RepID=UPI0033E482DE
MRIRVLALALASVATSLVFAAGSSSAATTAEVTRPGPIPGTVTVAVSDPNVPARFRQVKPSNELRVNADKWVVMENRNAPGKCLEIRGDSLENGAGANLWECNGSDTQTWGSRHVFNGLYEFGNLNSRKCLEIRGDSTANGAEANQWTCNESPTQLWIWYWDSVTNQSIFGNSNSSAPNSRCLEALSWGTSNGTPVGQWACHYGDNQAWYVYDV